MAIVLDSDRASESDSLKPHVRKILDEMKGHEGVAWVTAGREIENYVDGARLQAALRTLHPRLYRDAGNTGTFDHAFHFWRDNPDKPGERKTYKDGDKIGAANIICREAANLDRLDLGERIGELVALIRKANGLLPP